ncbi:MAG: hypothetical protein PVTTEEND_000028 [Candidatus Fervidibacter sp.]
MDLPPYPRLWLNRNGIVHRKERINRYGWAEARWEALKRRTHAAPIGSVNLLPHDENQ